MEKRLSSFVNFNFYIYWLQDFIQFLENKDHFEGGLLRVSPNIQLENNISVLLFLDKNVLASNNIVYH